MKRVATLIFIITVLISTQTFGQYPPFTKWYQNPLGFKPVNLHTANGIIIPAVAATAILLLTKNDKSIANRFSYYDDIGVSYGFYASKTTVYQNNIGLLYQARKFMSLGAEFSTVHVTDDMNKTWGFGLRPFVRFYPVHKDNFKIFFQSGAGLILFADNYPKPSGFFGDNREGTKLNGSPKYGIGTEFKLTKQLSGQAGLWHIHFSNGNHPSYDRNPGHDSNGFSVGLIYKPNKDNH
jgi:hypothetical protein